MRKNANYTLFGIPNCNTVKKVRDYLEANKVSYEFVDFKKSPPNLAQINRWKVFMKGWPVNTKGPTYRKIREQFEKADDSEKMKLLIENSSAIKRPILEENGTVQVIGYDLQFYK